MVKFVPPVFKGAEIEVQDESNLQSRFPKGLNVSAANGTPFLFFAKTSEDQ